MQNLQNEQSQPQLSYIAILSVSMYIAFQIFADILSTKIAFLPSLALAIDGGTIIYPLTFTVRDFVHKTLGRKAARNVVFTAGVLNIVMVLLFAFVGSLQPDSSWALQDAYDSILMPIWRITIASIIAEIFSELVDAEIFSRIYKKAGSDVLAVLASNFIALALDSIIFGMIAFYGDLPNGVVVQIVVANILVKGAMSIAFAPVIKLIPRTVSDDMM